MYVSAALGAKQRSSYQDQAVDKQGKNQEVWQYVPFLNKYYSKS